MNLWEFTLRSALATAAAVFGTVLVMSGAFLAAANVSYRLRQRARRRQLRALPVRPRLPQNPQPDKDAQPPSAVPPPPALTAEPGAFTYRETKITSKTSKPARRKSRR